MKNITLFLAIVAAITLSACGKGDQGEPGQVVFVPASIAVPTVPAEQANIDAIIADENAYRAGLGQTSLSNGLSCTLYTVTGGQYIQNDGSHSPTLTGVTSVATFTFADIINQPDSAVSDTLNLLPAPLRANPRYTNLIKLVCTGQIVVTTTGYYNFDLTSDDGSVLYLDGSRLIDNDGNHGSTLKSGTKYLRKGVHAFRFDFAQTGGGSQSLILQANGGFIPGAYLYH